MFSIICVTWKNQKQALELVESIKTYSRYKTHEIIIFHNECNSLNATVLFLTEHDGVANIINTGDIKNLGLSKAADKMKVLSRAHEFEKDKEFNYILDYAQPRALKVLKKIGVIS